MRKEIENWWKQAEKDFDSAKKNFEISEYYLTAFLCQQAVEKGLKAFILAKTREKRIEGHSLVYLGKEAKLPPNFFPGLKKLSPQYFLSRYPDVTEDVPYELYDEKLAKEFLDIARGVLEWIRKRLR